MIIAVLLICSLFVAFIFSVIFTTTSPWTYVVIYLLLFYIWYKPTLVLYHSIKAGHMLKKKEYSGVSKEYQKIAELKKNEGYGDYANGLAYYYQKNFSQAKDFFEKALERGIRTQKKAIEPLTKMALVATYMELKKWRKAQEYIEEIEHNMESGKKLSPKLLAIFYPIKGEFLYHQKQEESALRAFQLGYTRYPELMGEESYYYAKLLIQRQKYDEAKDILQKLLSPSQKWKFFRVKEEEAMQLLKQVS
jgi:tetratricopeptide (TPR) repeat protein